MFSRRGFISIILVLSVTLAFSQGSKSIEETNGFDWVTWSTYQKLGYVQGFLSANSAIWKRFVSEGNNTVSDEVLREYFYYPLNTVEVILKIDSYYTSYEYRKYPLMDVIMVVGGKDYWTKGENIVN